MGVGGLEIKYLLYVNLYSLRNFYTPNDYLVVLAVFVFVFLFGGVGFYYHYFVEEVFFGGGGESMKHFIKYCLYVNIHVRGSSIPSTLTYLFQYITRLQFYTALMMLSFLFFFYYVLIFVFIWLILFKVFVFVLFVCYSFLCFF